MIGLQTEERYQSPGASSVRTGALEPVLPRPALSISLLTGCMDRPYALGLADALTAQGIRLDFIGSDTITSPELEANHRVAFFNLRGDQSSKAGFSTKFRRIGLYYLRLIRYVATARPPLFHLLWNNKFELFDRTFLMAYYRLLGKKLVFTVHNVNAGKRDGNDSVLNRFSLRVQYRLADHLFVHTNRMKEELMRDFSVPQAKITVIPFGLNNTAPTSALTNAQARTKLGLAPAHKTILFFGNIAPYKGLHDLITALGALAKESQAYRLIIAGPVKNCAAYWAEVQESIRATGTRPFIFERTEFIPDEEVELYFKAADVLVLPYLHIFQSGVLVLGYNFGLPVIAADVGSLRDEIVEGVTGFVCRPADPADLAAQLRRYFASPLYQEFSGRRAKIREYAAEKYSWPRVGEMSRTVYEQLLAGRSCSN
jgi:glycosyltransferase involved in cell wall biosynthesis